MDSLNQVWASVEHLVVLAKSEGCGLLADG